MNDEKDVKIEARVYNDGLLWYGEVYAIWECIFGEREGWNDVTSGHFTKLGAILELKLWLKRHSYTYINIK